MLLSGLFVVKGTLISAYFDNIFVKNGGNEVLHQRSNYEMNHMVQKYFMGVNEKRCEDG